MLCLKAASAMGLLRGFHTNSATSRHRPTPLSGANGTKPNDLRVHVDILIAFQLQLCAAAACI
jgi:hypothetical protein